MKGTMVDAGRMRWVQGNQDGSVSEGGGGEGGSAPVAGQGVYQAGHDSGERKVGWELAALGHGT